MHTPPATPQPPRWTDNDLHLAIQLAWQTGRDYIPQGLADAIDDAKRTANTGPPTLTYEERVAARMETIRGGTTTGNEYLGGPVQWDSTASRPVPARPAADPAARASRPIWAEGDWRAVHHDVTPTVWWRIWWDLHPDTRTKYADLAPQGALPLEAVTPR